MKDKAGHTVLLQHVLPEYNTSLLALPPVRDTCTYKYTDKLFRWGNLQMLIMHGGVISKGPRE